MQKPFALSRVASTVLIALLAAVIVPPVADAADKLPSAVRSRIKRINQRLDQAVKAIEADRLTTAKRKLKDARKIHRQITDRYAGKFSADEPTYKAMTTRLAEVAEKIEGAASSAQDATAKSQKAKQASDALCQSWVAKLGPFVDRRSDLYLRLGAELNRASAKDQAKSKAAYPKAKALFEEYQKVTFPLGKTIALQNIESSLSTLLRYYGHGETKAKQEEASRQWVALLSPFVRFTPGSRKILIASATASPADVRKQQAIYKEAKKAFEACQKVKFPDGKSWKLRQVEQELSKRLNEFPAAMAQSMAMISGDIGKRLKSILAYLGRDTSWKKDPKKKPPTIMERDLKPLREQVRRLAGAAKPGDRKAADLKARLKAIEETNRKHRGIRAKRTYQLPDRYKGGDLAALKAKANAVATKANPKARVLRTTVPSAAWAIEDVIEATDTTYTALRRRITRSVRAQVALRPADRTVRLQEVYLGQDRRPDGSWGPLKGHTTWADAMARENIGKDGPAGAKPGRSATRVRKRRARR